MTDNETRPDQSQPTVTRDPQRPSASPKGCSKLQIDLSALVKNPGRVSDVDPAEIPVLLTQLSAVQASMAARLVAATADACVEASDRLLTIKEAARLLGLSQDWLYRRTRKLPFVVRVGRHVRFSANGIARYIRKRQGA